MTREEAIQKSGLATVQSLESKPCDFTGRLMPDPTCVEFSASVSFSDPDEIECHLIAYYYQDEDDINALADGDLGSLTWSIHHFEVQ